MQATVKWVDGVQFLAESGSGHGVLIEGPESEGGRNFGVRPMEMILMGLGGCTSFDVLSILKKSRQDVTACVAQISAQRADDIPSVFTSIHVHFVVTGRSLKESQVKRAVSLSADKYCSASIMLGRGGVDMTHDYEIIAE
jgi:putative redox protein